MISDLRIGLRSLPYLGDHGVQDMALLPGSFYIDAALSLHRERFTRAPGIVRNIAFPHPVVLSTDDTVMRVKVSDHGNGALEYLFDEKGIDSAKLEIDRDPPPPLGDALDFSIKAFQASAEVAINGGQFYRALRDNGNQYGPAFQNVSGIWRQGEQVLAMLVAPRPRHANETHYIQPTLLDSITQVLAPFVLAKGRPFILKSIESLAVGDTEFPETLWAHAVVRATAEGSCVGNVRVFDRAGSPYIELTGVELRLLDRVGDEQGRAATTLAIAANFTAEPLEDSLRFWSGYFGAPVRFDFAPFNQVFQQLLDPRSAFRRNGDGTNIILLALEEWATARPAPMLDAGRADGCFAGRTRYVLPNGLEIAHLNRYETDYIYQEVFGDRCYVRHGIHLKDGDTVVDIGANIGLFSLFVMSCCRDPRIYAYEPAPAVYELLKANCDAYGSHVRAVNAGVSARPGTARFTFYERSSVFSSFRPDAVEDRAAVAAVVRNMLRRATPSEAHVLDRYVEELTADRLDGSTHECRLTSVSEIIRDNQIERINLLKIDAEKSELDILNGIEEPDWPKIDQIAIEIHDRTGNAVTRIQDLLIGKGYRCRVESETLLEGSGLFNVYATRHESSSETRIDRRVAALRSNTQDFCAALRAFMTHSASPLMVCVCPRSPAAHADADLTAALDEAEEAILTGTRLIRGVHTINSTTALARYPVSDYYDPYRHQVGHIPYTTECYAAIGTALIRALVTSASCPFKVIAVDCDSTLWKGICGEDGPTGVEITTSHRALQEFLLGQARAGMLLCLCSRNNEQDVFDVFEQRSDMVLTREHLAATRINWKSKSDNIRSLAAELNLGLDSFIFIDDSPIECADVRINCPGVLTLQLPARAESFPSFLNHAWAFDRPAGSTREDHNRTRMYHDSAARDRFREETLSLRDFIDGLRLRVDISGATDADVGRVSQLTFRTNQFNFTTIRRSEREISQFLQRGDTACLVVRAADRFGDYGLVGVVMYETSADRYKVDTLLLSCRVLGRGVEHAVVSHLGHLAVEQRKSFVELTFRPTSRNLPAHEFINSIGNADRNADGTSWTFPAEQLATVEYVPDHIPSPTSAVSRPRAAVLPTSPPAFGFDVVDRSQRFQHIAEHLCDVGRLTRAIEDRRPRGQPVDDAPGTSGALQTALLTIWRKVLGRPRIRVDDNFFDAGGTSLSAVQVIAAIKKELKQTLSIVTLFECPTVALLADRLGAASKESRAETAIASAAQRGQQRRYGSMRRQAS